MAGYKVGKIPFVPISGLEGDNMIIERSTNLDWYKGPTLLEALDQINFPQRLPNNPLRLPVQDVYRLGDIGTVVGRIEIGNLKPGMLVTFAPSGLTTKVKSVEMDHKSVEEAVPGDNVVFTVEGNLAFMDLKCWHVASDSEDNPAKSATNFTAYVSIINSPDHIGNGYTPEIYCHTSYTTVKFSKILKKIDKSTHKGIETEPSFLKNGDGGFVEMTLTEPMVVEAFSTSSKLGRFALRDRGQTVAGGIIKAVLSSA